MLAQCPECQTIFVVIDEDMTAHGGLVRCGVCRHPFNAPWNLVDHLPEVAMPTPRPDHEIFGGEGDGRTPQDEPGKAVAVDENSRNDNHNERVQSDQDELLHDIAASIEVDEEIVLGAVAIDATPVPVDAVLQDATLDQPADENGDEPVEDGSVDEEIVLETSVKQGPRPEPAGKPVVRKPVDRDRIHASVDQMRALLSPSMPSPQRQAPPYVSNDEAVPGNADPQVSERVAHSERNAQDGPKIPPPDQNGVTTSTRPSPKGEPAATGGPGVKASRGRIWRAIGWSIGALLLTAVVLWQMRSFYLEDLSQIPALRPYLQKFCQVAVCQVPLRRDAKLIDLVGTHVENHPDVPGALRVTASLVNRANFSQPYPLLEVMLTNKLGGVTGRRAYTPTDYGKSPTKALLEPNVVSQVTIDLASPNERAVGYEIQLVLD